MADPDIAVEPAMQSRIKARLQQVEQSEGVRVLFAAESGSRAWGFGSPDSDYDVRFIYAHDMSWYLRLLPGRDVIEADIDENLIDLSGWDIDKTLRLLIRSNPSLYEWLVSPIVYIDDGSFATAARKIFEETSDRSALAHHYKSIAEGQWKREIHGRDRVRLKKYFYVIRPLLSLHWILSDAAPPPMHIDALLEAGGAPPDVRGAVEDLIVLKRETPELGDREPIAALDQWITDTLAAPLTVNPNSDTNIADNRVKRAQNLFNSTLGIV